jgi:hypothetical protein
MLTNKEKKWLLRIRDASRGSGMYPGEYVEFVPAKVQRSLLSKGLIGSFIPHNPVHKERLVTTHKGDELAREIE